MPRHRTWTDDSLRIAIAASRSWKDVCESLAVPVGGKTVNSLRRRADELGLDYLIPYDVIGQRLSARLGARYDGFKVG